MCVLPGVEKLPIERHLSVHSGREYLDDSSSLINALGLESKVVRGRMFILDLGRSCNDSRRRRREIVGVKQERSCTTLDLESIAFRQLGIE